MIQSLVAVYLHTGLCAWVVGGHVGGDKVIHLRFDGKKEGERHTSRACGSL